MPPLNLTPQDRRRLCATAGVDVKSVVRAYAAAGPMKPITIERISVAAAALGLPPPPRAQP